MCKKTILSVFFLFLLCFSYAHAQSNNSIENEILHYVNTYRAQHHLQLLTMNAVMSQEAYTHSRDMAEHKMGFGHTDFNKRIARSYKQFNLKNAPGAENVAYNYKTARIVVDGWLKSPGHLNNIRGNYNLTGIGVARDKQGKLYFTQIFMRA